MAAIARTACAEAHQNGLRGATVKGLHKTHLPTFNCAKAEVMVAELWPQGRQQGPCSARAMRLLARPTGAVNVLDRRFGCGAVAVVSATRQARKGEHSGKPQRHLLRFTSRSGEPVTARPVPVRSQVRPSGPSPPSTFDWVPCGYAAGPEQLSEPRIIQDKA